MAKRPWQAQYYSTCPACGEKVEPGDEAVFNDNDQVVHVECYDGELWEES